MILDRIGLMTLLDCNGAKLDQMIEDQEIPAPFQSHPVLASEDFEGEADQIELVDCWDPHDAEIRIVFRERRGRPMRKSDIREALAESIEIQTPGTWHIGQRW